VVEIPVFIELLPVVLKPALLLTAYRVYNKCEMRLFSLRLSIIFPLIYFFIVPVHNIQGQSVLTDSMRIELSGGWEYRWGDSPKDGQGIPEWTYKGINNPEWKPMELPGWATDRKDRNYLWQRVTLPEGSWRDPSIFTLGPFLYFEVYLDNEVLYRSGNPDIPVDIRLTGTPWHLIHLPLDFQGKMLYFRIYSNYYLIGINDRVFLGSHAENIKYMIVRDMDRIITGALCIFLGLFSLSLYLRNRNLKEFLSFGFFAFWVGIYIIRYTQIKQFFTDFHSLWTYLWLFSLFLIPIGIIAFIEQTFGAGFKSIIRRLWQVHIGISVFSLSLIFISFHRFAIAGITAIRILYIVYMLLIIITLLIHALKGNFEAIIFLIGFGFLGVFGLYDIFVGFGLIGSSRPIAHLGMFAFTLTLSVIILRRLIEMHSNVKRYSRRVETMSREKEKMISELHDGIGGIMTNINLLAEIAKQTESKKKNKKTFTTISSLSREGLLEIRSFMHSLDEKETTWDSLVAECRFHGMNTLETYGINFTINTKIDKKINQPGGLLFLNIYRIYREALTNIIKHSNAKTVNVELLVSSILIELKIRDNGTGLQMKNYNGRGLANMKKRAQEIGGSISIISNNGISIHLAVTPRKTTTSGYDSAVVFMLY
jgi:signal transduction histidine kinase